MVDGRVLHGHIGRAGHLGHVSLEAEGAYDIVNTPGSLEDAIGEHNVMVRSNGEFASTRELVEAFRMGSTEAEKVWLRSVRQLGAAIAGFINVLDPELILIGGGIADADDALFQPLQTALDKFEWRPAGTDGLPGSLSSHRAAVCGRARVLREVDRPYHIGKRASRGVAAVVEQREGRDRAMPAAAGWGEQGVSRVLAGDRRACPVHGCAGWRSGLRSGN